MCLGLIGECACCCCRLGFKCLCILILLAALILIILAVFIYFTAFYNKSGPTTTSVATKSPDKVRSFFHELIDKI